MNERIYNIQMKIEEKLNKTSNERLKNEYYQILQEEEEIDKILGDKDILKMESAEYKKKKYYAKLELFYEHICEDYIVLIEDLKESINNNSYNEEELSNIIKKIRQKIENDKELSLSEYKQIRIELDTLLLQINEKNNEVKQNDDKIMLKQEQSQLIKPRKPIFKRFITLTDFYKQFGFYPIFKATSNEILRLYDLSYIDYTSWDLSQANFEETNFSFDLELLRNNDISYANFKNTNVSFNDLDNFNFNYTNFEGVNLKNSFFNIEGGVSAYYDSLIQINGVNVKNTGLNICINGYVALKNCNFEGCSIKNNGIAIDVDGSNLKDTGIIIDLEYIKNNDKKMVNGDYRGCKFFRDQLVLLENIDKENSKFDEILQYISEPIQIDFSKFNKLYLKRLYLKRM